MVTTSTNFGKTPENVSFNLIGWSNMDCARFHLSQSLFIWKTGTCSNRRQITSFWKYEGHQNPSLRVLVLGSGKAPVCPSMCVVLVALRYLSGSWLTYCKVFFFISLFVSCLSYIFSLQTVFVILSIFVNIFHMVILGDFGSNKILFVTPYILLSSTPGARGCLFHTLRHQPCADNVWWLCVQFQMMNQTMGPSIMCFCWGFASPGSSVHWTLLVSTYST